jgi:dGTP triphosphohydrolase
MNDFGAIVAAASLAHDIRNPPFGHSGEKAIGYFPLEMEKVPTNCLKKNGRI